MNLTSNLVEIVFPFKGGIPYLIRSHSIEFDSSSGEICFVEKFAEPVLNLKQKTALLILMDRKICENN